MRSPHPAATAEMTAVAAGDRTPTPRAATGSTTAAGPGTARGAAHGAGAGRRIP
ncbi:hypothetical protein L1856_14925 [Streptomyces sp. Tue 6430]|nr:hypothetical protein [Streptomyces sp. Tue 6430]